MTDNGLDKIFKDKLAGYSEDVPDVWEGISSSLDRKRRAVFVRWFSIGSVAAAASVAALLFLSKPVVDQPSTLPAAKSTIVSDNLVEDSDPVVEDILPIKEQIRDFIERPAVAEAVLPVEEVTVPTPEIAGNEAEAALQNESEPMTVTVSPSPSTDEDFLSDDALLSEEDLPSDFWKEDIPSKRHTSQISISSNLAAGATDGLSRIYNGTIPMHSASQTGKGYASSGVVPLSTSPKFDVPLAVGLQFKTALAKRFYAGAGVNMTYLVSQYDALVNDVYYEGIYNQLWYVGIPVSLYYHFVDSDNLGLYATVGGTAEKCVGQRYVYGSNTLHEKVKGIQYSVDAGFGAEYRFSRLMSIYLDPSVVYYFDNSQPLSIRTQQPLQFRMELGLRFRL